MSWPLLLAEKGWIPDSLIRMGIRRLLRRRLAAIDGDSSQRGDLLKGLRQGPLAHSTDAANEQHYEVPPKFFELVLGRHLKYSSCFWYAGTASLEAAEVAALELTCERADLHDGMRVLDLGCGWGSLSLWIAERYPRCHVTAVSNSAPQGELIRRRAAERDLGNVEVVTADMNTFQPAGTFDRIVSVEMFEHLRNYEELFRRLGSWIASDGRLFVHVFCHRETPYLFEDRDDDDWMARHFFTGGLMPSERLMESFRGPFRLERRWRVAGRHYERTANAWLANVDEHRRQILEIFREAYGPSQAALWLQRWRMFFMACAELFGYRGGEEWFVSHTRWSLDES